MNFILHIFAFVLFFFFYQFFFYVMAMCVLMLPPPTVNPAKRQFSLSISQKCLQLFIPFRRVFKFCEKGCQAWKKSVFILDQDREPRYICRLSMQTKLLILKLSDRKTIS